VISISTKDQLWRLQVSKLVWICLFVNLIISGAPLMILREKFENVLPEEESLEKFSTMRIELSIKLRDT